MSENLLLLQSTPLPVIANVSRVVTLVVDRITGDRVDFPLLVAAACVEGLKNFQIESRVMFGKVAWIEIMEDHSSMWAGCWGDNFHFWVATQFGEIVDLNTSVACRKRAHSDPNLKSLYSPPILWSSEVPGFYRYAPEGVAELDLLDQKDQARYSTVMAEVKSKCGYNYLPAQSELFLKEQIEGETHRPNHMDVDLDFPNEPILCPGRHLLDDSKNSFRHFDRALSVHGIPSAPF